MEILIQDSIRRGKSRKLISSRAQSSRGNHDPAEVRADTVIRKQKYLPDPVNGVRTRSVQVMRPSEPWGQTPMVFPGLRTKPTTPRRFAEHLTHLRTLVGEGVGVTWGGLGIFRFRSSWSPAQGMSPGEFGVQRCCFVRKTTVPKGLCSLLHPDPCFTPEFMLEGFLEVLGFSVRHGGVPFYRL